MSQDPTFKIKAMGSVNSRKLWNFALAPAPSSNPTLPLVISQQTFQVDPSCPYFYIFAQGSPKTSEPLEYSFATQFDFLNGGSLVNSETLYWGNEAALDVSTQPYQVCVNVIADSP